MHPLKNALLIFVTVAMLAGCGEAPVREAPRSGASDGGAAASRAYDEGRYAEAAAGFERLAANDPARRDPWLLRAAEAAFRAGDEADMSRLLIALDERRLGGRERARASLLRAVSGRESMPALRRLALLDSAAPNLDPGDRVLYHELRADALAESGQPYASALERIRLARLLPESERARENRLAIARTLQQLTAAQARRLLERHDPDDVMHGWLALVASVKDALYAGRDPAAAAADWRARFPGHPAGLEAAERLGTEYDRGFAAPDHIAVLLPESGPMEGAGRAVRDGVVAAYLGAGGAGELRFHDSGPTPAAAVAAYRRAIAEGATAVIGPLAREAVTAVVLEADGTVPVLALNYTDLDAPVAPGVYQFGLLPEQEAAAAAEQMLRDGHERASVLTPNSAWGDRLRDAFVRRFLQLGGVVYDESVYPEGANDFGATIERIVGLQAAEARKRELQGDLGLRVNFEALRRPDLDALFVAARPREGRLIKPQLAFHSAGDLPVYATSHVYTGREDREADEDLNAIRFCDAPWLIGSQRFQFELDVARDAFASADGGGARLLALGYDSYRLLAYLDWLARFPDDRFPGATGSLRVAAGGIIDRSPDCAAFVRGRPRHLAPSNDAALDISP